MRYNEIGGGWISGFPPTIPTNSHWEEPVVFLWDLWAFGALKWSCESVCLHCTPLCRAATQHMLGGVPGCCCFGVLHCSPYLVMRLETRKSCHTWVYKCYGGRQQQGLALIITSPWKSGVSFPFSQRAWRQSFSYLTLSFSPDPSTLLSVPEVTTELNGLQHLGLRGSFELGLCQRDNGQARIILWSLLILGSVNSTRAWFCKFFHEGRRKRQSRCDCKWGLGLPRSGKGFASWFKKGLICPLSIKWMSVEWCWPQQLHDDF